MSPFARTQDMSCSLLALPGGTYRTIPNLPWPNTTTAELRNRIYSFACEEGTISLKRVRDPAPIAWRDIKRQFLGLTQVCHMVRSEFLPIYRAQTKVSLLHYDFHEYIDTVLVSEGVSDDKVVGHLTLGIIGNEPLVRLNLKSLLQLMRRAKNLRLEFPIPMKGWTLEDMLVDMFDIRDKDTFYEYMSKAIAAFELLCGEYLDTKFMFEISPGYWEAWMEDRCRPDHDPDTSFPQGWDLKVVQWGTQCGMDLKAMIASFVYFRRGK